MNRRIASIGVGLIVACWELGCVATETRPDVPSDQQEAEPNLPVAAPGVGNSGDSLGETRGKDAGRGVGFGELRGRPEVTGQDAGDAPRDAAAPDTEAGQVDDDEPLPTGIFIATCESEPDEIAVPLNALEERYCDTVQAKAYRSDEEGSYEVSATYSWFIEDGSIANIYPLPGKEHAGIQRPSVMYDVFWSDDPDTEPETKLTVCATPKTGWPDQQPELCRTLPLRAVVNLDAAWCFAGATFQSECDARPVAQDGRYLTFDGDGPGSVLGRGLHFYKGDYYYEAVLVSNSLMSGTVTRMDTNPPTFLGAWQAERMSP